MKKNLVFILTPVVLLLLLIWTSAFYTFIPAQETDIKVVSEYKAEASEHTAHSSTEVNSVNNVKYKAITSNAPNGLINYALSLIGSPYVYAGTSPSGFDCSGFVTHVFGKYNVDLPHSSAMQADEGIHVPKQEARKGDLVIFTGTDPDLREPGHVGIVISAPGDTIEFVHASSNGGVKISKVEGTRYDLRYLEVRRVL